jgi:hypothetical protein
MSRWYWGAIACGLGFALAWLLPEYVTDEGGGVSSRDVGIGWNWRDADGNPLHDALGNRIKPNRVRTVALIGFGAGAVALVGAGLALPRKKKARIVRSCEETFPDQIRP